MQFSTGHGSNPFSLPWQSANEVLTKLGAGGVSVKIVSGHNELVTEHICKQLGLQITRILTETEIQQMDDQSLAAQVEG